MQTIPTPDTAALEAAAPAIVSRARALVVSDADSAQDAGRFLVDLATERKARVDAVAPAKQAAHAAHKAMTALEAKLVAPLDEARALAEPKLSAWQRAERERLENERRAAAEAARKAAEEKQLADAIEAEAFGFADVADAIIEDAPIVVVAPTPAPAPIAGISSRVTYRAEVYDLLSFVRHVAENSQMLQGLQPNIPWLNQIARALKTTMQLPGVRAVAEESVSVRSR